MRSAALASLDLARGIIALDTGDDINTAPQYAKTPLQGT